MLFGRSRSGGAQSNSVRPSLTKPGDTPSSAASVLRPARQAGMRPRTRQRRVGRTMRMATSSGPDATHHWPPLSRSTSPHEPAGVRPGLRPGRRAAASRRHADPGRFSHGDVGGRRATAVHYLVGPFPPVRVTDVARRPRPDQGTRGRRAPSTAPRSSADQNTATQNQNTATQSSTSEPDTVSRTPQADTVSRIQ